MTDAEFKYGLERRKNRIVMAASSCERHLRQETRGAVSGANRERITAAMSQSRFFPIDQRELIEAVMDLHDFETGSGKYQLTDAERLPKLLELAKEENPEPWVIKEVERLTSQSKQPT